MSAASLFPLKPPSLGLPGEVDLDRVRIGDWFSFEYYWETGSSRTGQQRSVCLEEKLPIVQLEDINCSHSTGTMGKEELTRFVAHEKARPARTYWVCRTANAKYPHEPSTSASSSRLTYERGRAITLSDAQKCARIKEVALRIQTREAWKASRPQTKREEKAREEKPEEPVTVPAIEDKKEESQRTSKFNRKIPYICANPACSCHYRVVRASANPCA